MYLCASHDSSDSHSTGGTRQHLRREDLPTNLDVSRLGALLEDIVRLKTRVAQAVAEERVLRLLHDPRVRVHLTGLVLLELPNVHSLLHHPGDDGEFDHGSVIDSLRLLLDEISLAEVALGAHELLQPGLLVHLLIIAETFFPAVRPDDDLPRHSRQLPRVVDEGVIDRERPRHPRGEPAHLAQVTSAGNGVVALGEDGAAGEAVLARAHPDLLVRDHTPLREGFVVLRLGHGDGIERDGLVDAAVAHVRRGGTGKADEPGLPRGENDDGGAEQEELGRIVPVDHLLHLLDE